MSIRFLNAAFNTDLPTGLKFTFVALCDYVDENGQWKVSHLTLARKTNQSRSTIIRHIQKLSKLGYIKAIKTRNEEGRQGANIYRVSLCDSGQSVTMKRQSVTDDAPECHRATPITTSTPPVHHQIDRPPACETRKTDISLAFENYNITADTFDLPRAIRLTEDRRKKLRQRLKEHGLDGWNKALENIEQSRFLQGDNERGWRISFDFMLQPTSLNKLIEGGYSDATGPPNEARAAFRNLRDGP